MGIVFPAGAGVFLIHRHRSGAMILSSPQARGCFCILTTTSAKYLSLPRRRGGVSKRGLGHDDRAPVFPAGAGVFL